MRPWWALATVSRLREMAEGRDLRLRSRLALAFVAVAVMAIVVLASLTMFATNRQVSRLVVLQQHGTARDVQVALASAYRQARGWSNANLTPALSLAASGGASLVIFDRHGTAIDAQSSDASALMSAMMGGTSVPTMAPLGPVYDLAVRVDNARVGRVEIRFASEAPSFAQRQVRDSLQGTVALGATVASLLALIVAWLVSRRITRPLSELTATVRAIEGGTRGARVEHPRAPGEIGELVSAFDRMANALSDEDSMRRQQLADVAHELRTPITILQATMEQMLDDERAASVEEIGSLSDEVRRLGRLVRDVETLAAAEAAGLHLTTRPTDVAEAAAMATRALRPSFEDADVTLVEEMEPAVVNGDADRLVQIVMNLVTNALKFSPPGTRVTVRVSASDGLAHLVVTDEGPGIDSADLEHIFERFWRSSNANRTSGSGIGLAVVAELVRAHGGRVAVASEPGGGTTFSVLLPLA